MFVRIQLLHSLLYLCLTYIYYLHDSLFKLRFNPAFFSQDYLEFSYSYVLYLLSSGLSYWATFYFFFGHSLWIIFFCLPLKILKGIYYLLYWNIQIYWSYISFSGNRMSLCYVELIRKDWYKILTYTASSYDSIPTLYGMRARVCHECLLQT